MVCVLVVWGWRGVGVIYKMLEARICDQFSVSEELVGLSPAQSQFNMGWLFLEYGFKLVSNKTKRQHIVHK